MNNSYSPKLLVHPSYILFIFLQQASTFYNPGIISHINKEERMKKSKEASFTICWAILGPLLLVALIP